MKKILLIVAILIFISNISQGQRCYNSFYAKHKNTKGIESFEISPSFFRFLMKDSEEKDMMKNLDKVSFFIADTAEKNLFDDLQMNLKKEDYKDMMVIKDGKSLIRFQAREGNSSIEEILLIAEDPGSLFIMCINGNFTLNEAKSLISSVDIENSVNVKH